MKGSKPNLSHICVLSARAWVHIPKEKRKKLDKRSWQGIHVGYEDTNQYRIYDPCTRKVHITRDVTIDEKNLFDRKAFEPHELVDDKWSQNNDNLFGNPDGLDNDQPTPQIPPTLSIQSCSNSDPVGELSQRNQPEERKDPAVDSTSESDSVLLKKSTRVPVKPVPYPREIAYGPGRENNFDLDLPSTHISTQDTPKSHTHMMKTLAMLANNEDNEGLDQPLTLKQAMARPNWPQ